MNQDAPRFLAVFDVDSTLICEEVIELLADMAGKRTEVAEVTERAMAGELDFASSLVERVNKLEGLPESVLAKTVASVTPSPGLFALVGAIHERGGKIAAVSGGFSQILEPLAANWGLDYHRANQLEIVDGFLTGKVVGQIVDRSVKAQMLRQWAEECEVPLQQTLAVGDGANDLDMLSVAGIGVAYNAKPIVREHARLCINGSLEHLIPLLP